MRVPPFRVSDRQPAHVLGQIVIPAGPEHEVPMLCGASDYVKLSRSPIHFLKISPAWAGFNCT
jgi:hypothetical protein